MKKCYKCKRNKDLSKFSKNKFRKDGLSAQCKKCHSILRREHYVRNKNKILKQVELQKQQYREWFRAIKDKPCVDCKIKYPSYVMQFDHTNPETKISTIAEMTSRTINKEKVLEEIDKCDIVCANCHAERTHKRKSGISLMAK